MRSQEGSGEGAANNLLVEKYIAYFLTKCLKAFTFSVTHFTTIMDLINR